MYSEPDAGSSYYQTVSFRDFSFILPWNWDLQFWNSLGISR